MLTAPWDLLTLTLPMLPTPVAPFRWTDPSSWPLFFKIWLGFVLVSWLVPLWRWLRREKQKSWPETSGLIESAHVGGPKRFLGLTLPARNNETYSGVLAYSYTISGDVFRGEYRRAFFSEEATLEFLRGLEGQAVSVQYNPNKPAGSVLLEDTVETLLRNRPPLPNALDWKDSLPAWLKPFIGFLAALALIGLLLSIWVHIGSLLRREAPPLAWGLHLGVFLVFFPAIFVAQKRLGTAQRRDFWKAVTKGSPDGLRYLLYFFFAYAWLSGLVAFAQAPPGASPIGHDPEWRLFSSVWMVFYSASFVILSTALRRDSDQR